MTMKPLGKMGRPACSVVIPTWRRADQLREVLDSLSRQTSSDFEVIVVSDGEDAPTRALAQNYVSPFPLTWHFHESNLGQSSARNTGARHAAGAIVLFLDDDTLANPTLIDKHLAHHRATGTAGPIAVAGRITEQRVGPVVRPTDRFLQANWERSLEARAERFGAKDIESVGEEFESGIAFGLNCSIPRSTFLQHYGFNQALRTTDEDMEMGIRLYRAGVYFVFEPDAIVTHRSSKDLTDYLQNCWKASGPSDLLRVFTLGERDPQTRRIVSLSTGGPMHRLAGKALWHTSGVLSSLVDRVASAANASNSGILLRAWGRIAPSATYWNSVKSAGCALDKLEQAAGDPKHALTLHSISVPHTPEEFSYYLSPARFRSFFQWFHKAGYRSATTREWMEDTIPAHRVLLTFDDGYDDLYTEMLPLFAELGLTALIFLVADQVGASNVWDQRSGLRARNLLTVDQIREMQRRGIEFGSHTVTHPWLPGLSDADLEHELADSKHRLEDLLGTEVTTFAYPYGGVDRRVRSAVVNAGYRQAFTILPGANWWNDPFTQRRAEINEYTSFRDFRCKVRTGLGFTASLGADLRAFGNAMPTATLRALIASLGSLGHHTVQSLSREAKDRNK